MWNYLKNIEKIWKLQIVNIGIEFWPIFRSEKVWFKFFTHKNAFELNLKYITLF